MSSPEAAPVRPLLTIVRGGEPTDEELAALVAVLAARSAAAGTVTQEGTLRQPLSPWVASGLIKGTRTKA